MGPSASMYFNDQSLTHFHGRPDGNTEVCMRLVLPWTLTPLCPNSTVAAMDHVKEQARLCSGETLSTQQVAGWIWLAAADP